MRPLVLDVDAEGRVHRELDVDRVLGHVQHGPDDAVGRDDRHVRPHVARPRIEHDTCHPKELGEVLADHLRAHRVPGRRVLELQEPPKLTVFDLRLLERANLLAQACVVVRESLGVLFHVDEVDIVVPHVVHAARHDRSGNLDGGREA